MPKVLLCWMPFGSAANPPLGVSLLKAGLSHAQVDCDVKYFSLDFARRVGLQDYKTIASHSTPYQMLIGEWLFATALFGEELVDAASYFNWLEGSAPGVPMDKEILALESAGAQVEPFLDECLGSLSWEEYDIVGFSSCFQQNIASLALAKRIKGLWPDKTILFGGQNVEGEMGVELLRNFDFVDYACLGEGDLFLPEFVRRVREGQSMQDLPGLAYRCEDQVLVSPGGCVTEDLDGLCYPDFDDYFPQRSANLGHEAPDPYLPFETSRDCWWGDRKPCAFCGALTPASRYRVKSPQRVLDEIEYLKDRYPVQQLFAADLLAPPDLGSYLPGLRNESPHVSLKYYTRANISKEPLVALKEAGVDLFFIGIESLSTPILRLMGKGTTVLDNIRMLKWCRELDILGLWVLFLGIPFEDPEEYSRMAELIPSLHHLQPPDQWGKLWVMRHSLHACKPEEFGLKNLRPADAYAYIYPGLPDEALGNLARRFDFEYADGRDPFSYSGVIFEAIKAWQEAAAESVLAYLDDGERLYLFDTRPVACQSDRILTGLERALYLACDSQQSLKRLTQLLATGKLPVDGRSDDQAQTSGGLSSTVHKRNQDVLPASSEEIQRILDALVSERLMVKDRQRYLSLAVDLGRYIKPELYAAIPDEFRLALVQSMIGRATGRGDA